MDVVTFAYTDAKGMRSQRHIRNPKQDEHYLRGYDLDEKAPRTFRLDRIDWEGEAPSVAVAKSLRPERVIDERLSVCFTGFKRDEPLPRLQAIADEAGLRVCKSVVVKLNFLVTGANAGPGKISKALQQGSALMDEDEFLLFLETGELPTVDPLQSADLAVPDGWEPVQRHSDYYWQVYMHHVRDDAAIKQHCRSEGLNIVFWQSLTQKAEIVVEGDKAIGRKIRRELLARGGIIVSPDEFQSLFLSQGYLPAELPAIAPYILFQGSGDDGDVIDVDVFFNDCPYQVKPAHYPVFNIMKDKQRILGRNENRIFLKHCYSLKKRDWLEFEEGDVFYLKGKRDAIGLQVIKANIDQVEVMSFRRDPEWLAEGYQIPPELLEIWLRTGNAPDSKKRINRGQSQSPIARFEYTS